MINHRNLTHGIAEYTVDDPIEEIINSRSMEGNATPGGGSRRRCPPSFFPVECHVEKNGALIS